MNVFSRLCNSSWPNPSCDYQMNGKDIRLGYMNLRGILDGKRTIRYESISDILISMFSGINKCLQGRNIFVIDFGLPQYQKFAISLICVSAEFPAYTGQRGPLASSQTNTSGPLKLLELQAQCPLFFGSPLVCATFIQYGTSPSWNQPMITPSRGTHNHPCLRWKLKEKQSMK